MITHGKAHLIVQQQGGYNINLWRTGAELLKVEDARTHVCALFLKAKQGKQALLL